MIPNALAQAIKVYSIKCLNEVRWLWRYIIYEYRSKIQPNLYFPVLRSQRVCWI